MTARDDLDDPTDRGLSPAYEPHVCADGWLLTSTDEHPRPCLSCKPHLARTERDGVTAWRPRPIATTERNTR